ncbi:hypothetical protein HNR42_000123 [Deinobacterium chartae]|uniref:IPT/TIG domain-containing protein n=1 Tax=Deinobacterium chartae TaxID=521158 RepID=A0A841HTH2_9DEIO|nr:IPT/TIG domain-containing protein [Deinobacterium chartae]MBB6096711.1 hypothetical protein [Deinobacterium chartae]
MKRAIILLTLTATLAACAPTQTQTPMNVQVTPVLVQVSEATAPGGTVTVQGRHLGGPSTARIRLGATEDGRGGYLVPAANIVSWTDSKIVFTVPAGAPVGGGWLFIEVAGRQSTGLPYSVKSAQ